jgi:hypothetical protein
VRARAYQAGDRISVQLDEGAAEAINWVMNHPHDASSSVSQLVISALKQRRAIIINRDELRADGDDDMTPFALLELPIREWRAARMKVHNG